MSQLASNADQGGIILCDIDEIEAECGEDGESHQIHLSRPLSDIEANSLQALGLSFDEDGDGDYIDGAPSEDFRAWISCGALSLQARTYLAALRA